MFTIFFILLTSFFQNTEYSLEFNKVDNRINVIVGDSLVFDSQSIDHSPELKFTINLSNYLTTQNQKIKVILYNGHPPYESQVDPLWEVRFELFRGKEELDFFHESGNDNRLGKVLELEIDLSNY